MDKDLLEYQFRLKETINEINIHLAEMKVDLRHHIARTDALEGLYQNLAADQARLDKQLSRWAGATALSGWIVSTVIALTAVLIKFF